MRDTPKALLSGPVLALDWGRRKVGMASCDAEGLAFTSHPIFEREASAQKWLINKREFEFLKAFCQKWEIAEILFGIPYSSLNEESLRALQFAEHLKKKMKMPVHIIDEALSTWEARKTAGEEAEDSKAAALFLRDFFETLKRGHKL